MWETYCLTTHWIVLLPTEQGPPFKFIVTSGRNNMLSHAWGLIHIMTKLSLWYMHKKKKKNISSYHQVDF